MANFDMEKFKKMGEEWVEKIKESGVIDKVKSGVKEGVDVVSSRLRGTMPGSVRQAMNEVHAVLEEIVKKKQAGEDDIDALTAKARENFEKVIEACQAVKKIETQE